MGLFDKKYCSVCGEKIGLLGNRKLEDGNLCKKCAKKLSPWFSERRHSIVDDIKGQLAYREENQQKVAQFHASRTYGNYWKVMLDESHHWLVITQAHNLQDANPDVIDFANVTGCRYDIDEHQTELKHKNADGEPVSYNPPRYEFRYEFEMTISVNSLYFDEMRFRLNSASVRVTTEMPTGFGRMFGGMLNGYDQSYNPEYRQYKELADELCCVLNSLGQETVSAQQPPIQHAAPVLGPWNCSACGAANEGGKFCQFCGSPRT
jgi:hypothetical protein